MQWKINTNVFIICSERFGFAFFIFSSNCFSLVLHAVCRSQFSSLYQPSEQTTESTATRARDRPLQLLNEIMLMHCSYRNSALYWIGSMTHLMGISAFITWFRHMGFVSGTQWQKLKQVGLLSGVPLLFHNPFLYWGPLVIPQGTEQCGSEKIRSCPSVETVITVIDAIPFSTLNLPWEVLIGTILALVNTCSRNTVLKTW